MKKSDFILDTYPKKLKRGRPGVQTGQIAFKSQMISIHLAVNWDEIRDKVIQTKNGAEILSILESTTNTTLKHELTGMEEKFYSVVHENKFPSRQKAQIRYIADSLAGCLSVSTRRSRDICAELRSKEKVQNRIIRKEFFIECTCGYQGAAKYGKCARCGTGEIDPSLEYKEFFNA